MKKLSILLVLGIVTAGCGGGGGSDGPKFAGTWKGQLIVTENSCQTAVENFEVTDLVNQDGNTIVLQTEKGGTYQGFVTGEDSFSVSRQDEDQCVNLNTQQPVAGSTSIVIRSIDYSGVDGDAAQVTFTYDEGNCTKNTGVFSNACKVVWKGLVTRS